MRLSCIIYDCYIFVSAPSELHSWTFLLYINKAILYTDFQQSFLVFTSAQHEFNLLARSFAHLYGMMFLVPRMVRF